MSQEPEVYWIGIKEYRWQNEEIERKLIGRNVHYSFKMFCSLSLFLET
jgi:hypothetical protein